MARMAHKQNAHTFQFFTRNPRGAKAKDIDPADIAKFHELKSEYDIPVILAHAPYTLNPAAADEHIREFALMTMRDDLMRMEKTPGNLYNFHPGSHVKQGPERGVELISDALNQILTPDITTTVLLETMAGKGTEVGRTFEEIQSIIERVELSDKLGVCMDTCHIWDGGYDIVNHLDDVLEEFDQVIGLKRLKAIHLNDSKNPLGAHKDRHAALGEGHIGWDALVRVVEHPALKGLPFYLETPRDDAGHAEEIARIYAAISQSN